ncbi:MAG: ligase-associated DNA damage response exonuclease [Oligoflexia bacterium]|nr:ligase-associated DNA damage response exonuclease [Oligoflexia bacterium]
MARAYGNPLLTFEKGGLYCEAGDFHIDPARAVDTALITHAHSDHARKGSRRYLCVQSSVGLLRSRLGPKAVIEGVPYGETLRLGAARVSFHPAGHILGSAQVRVEVRGRVWVASGDYKREPDPTCEPFEVVPCETFVTEATFGTPGFVWEKGRKLGAEIHAWWEENARAGRNALLFGYSLGKAQRILGELAPLIGDREIVIHETVAPATSCYREQGVRLAPTRELAAAVKAADGGRLRGELILAPPSVERSEWLEALGEYETAFASGWMQGDSPWGQRQFDRGFVMSDHADWEDLNRTVRETGARRIFVMHRGNGAFVRHLKRQGLEAYPISALAREPRETAHQLELL